MRQLPNIMRRNEIRQTTFAEGSFARFHKPARRERFFVDMEKVVGWSELMVLIELVYPKPGNDHFTIGLERMQKDLLTSAMVQLVGSGGGFMTVSVI